VCGSDLASTRARGPDGGPRFWVAVRAGFTCRSCGFLAPLDHLPEGGAVECASCGLRQAFETAALGPALAHAHAAGDLAGPNAEGRTPNARLYIGAVNPFKSLAVDHTFDTYTDLIDGRPLKVEVGPGHPICVTCKAPLEAGAVGGVVSTRCPSCSATGRYLLPEGFEQLCPGLVGVVAPDHSDQLRAKQAVGAGGVVALACPGCGAPIGNVEGRRVVPCNFCHASVLIPLRAAAQTSEGPPKSTVWWLLFEGASPKRVDLETPMALAPVEETSLTETIRKMKGLKSTGPKAVEVAPEAPGIGLLQLGVSVVAALLMLAIAYPIAAAMSPDVSPPARRAPSRTRHR
jgi:DNA-directed RNA polymerase subunit RPC12/RpoP